MNLDLIMYVGTIVVIAFLIGMLVGREITLKQQLKKKDITKDGK